MTGSSLRRRAGDLSPGLKYLLVGGLSYAIDIGVLTLAWHVAGLPLWLATTCGFWCSFSVNFLLSRHWTFDAAEDHPRSQLVRFGVLVVVNYVATVVMVTGFHRLGIGALEARTVALVLLTGSTFFAYRRWVFVSR